MTLIYQNNEISHWYDLILLAQKDSAINLEHELEGYVVMMLMRFNRRPSLANAVLAIEFLESFKVSGSRKHTQLREVADQCLLYSGLFPKRAKRKRVSSDYFIELGQSAYQGLRDHLFYAMPVLSKLYAQLSEEFIKITDVIYAMRDQNQGNLDFNYVSNLKMN